MLAAPTGKLVLPQWVPTEQAARGVMMPRRTRTRTEEHAARIAAERRINEERLAEEHRKRAAQLAANDEPPPF